MSKGIPIWNWTFRNGSDGEPNTGLSLQAAALSDTWGSDSLLRTGSSLTSSSGDAVPESATLWIQILVVTEGAAQPEVSGA
jgi:hypothetical protein